MDMTEGHDIGTGLNGAAISTTDYIRALTFKGLQIPALTKIALVPCHSGQAFSHGPLVMKNYEQTWKI